MVGYIQEAVAEAIRNWATLRQANVVPVRAVDGSSIVVNTTLPAVIINIVGTDGDGNTFIGGGIRQYFDLELWVLLDVPNYSFSNDRGLQAAKLDLSDDVIRCVEHPDFLLNIKRVHDLNMMYDKMETETTYGTKDALSMTIDVHKVIYNCSVQFNPEDEDYNRYVDLVRINLNNNDVNESVITSPDVSELLVEEPENATITPAPDSYMIDNGENVDIELTPEAGFNGTILLNGVDQMATSVSFNINANTIVTTLQTPII